VISPLADVFVSAMVSVWIQCRCLFDWSRDL